MIRDRLREGNKGLFGGVDGWRSATWSNDLVGGLLTITTSNRLQKIVSGPVPCVAHQDQFNNWRAHSLELAPQDQNMTVLLWRCWKWHSRRSNRIKLLLNWTANEWSWCVGWSLSLTGIRIYSPLYAFMRFLVRFCKLNLCSFWSHMITVHVWIS